MNSTDIKSVCNICYTPDQNEIWKCAKCGNMIHKECAALLGIKQASSQKKLKYESSVYAQIRTFPQITDPHCSEGFQAWICDSCQEIPNTSLTCYFCYLSDGLMAKIKFKDQEKDSKRKSMEVEDEVKWAHINCILKLYGKKPILNRSASYFTLETDILADAPVCHTCGPPFKLDVRCNKCKRFCDHNLCMSQEKNNVKFCSSCSKPEIAPPKVDSKSPGTYLSRFIKEIIRTKKYDDFCKEKIDFGTEDVENQSDEIEEEDAAEEGPIGLTDHYYELNDENELVYSFPLMTKESLAGQIDLGSQKLEEEVKQNNDAAKKKGKKGKGKADDKNIASKEEEMSPKPKNAKKNYNVGLDTLMFQARNLYYISSFQVLVELQRIYLTSCFEKDSESRLKLTRKWYKLMRDIEDKDDTCLKTYDEKMKKEINDQFQIYSRFRVPVETWPMIPKSYRKYEWLEEFVININSKSFKKEIEGIMNTRKTHKCQSDCDCCRLDKLGPYLHEKQAWDTTCPGRAGLMECDENCGCDLTVCKNRAISTRGRKKLDQEVKETFCWGIDFATHHEIQTILPTIEGVDKDDFIEKKLLRAVHLSDTPWDMISVCKKIVEKSREGSKLFSEADGYMAKMLIRAIKFIKHFDSKAFRLHSKGYGVICVKEDGIDPNDLISEYYGELYTAWRWFEKQDLVKRYFKEKNKKNLLPDFYNIILERHKDDPDGYDILVVDPINKGNYVSRFSHSCDPNCGTVPTISKGKYGIAMYSLRHLSYGEELTFDYFSVTENDKEYRQAICLCGSRNCRVHYLNLVTSKNQHSYLEKNLCFLKRNYLIYKCMEDPLTTDDFELLDFYSIRSSILDNCPDWLKKWIVLVLRFVREERNQYVEYNFARRREELELQFRKKVTAEMIDNLRKTLDIEKFTLESDRIQNLTITVNKIKHVIALIKEKSLKSKSKTVSARAKTPKTKEKAAPAIDPSLPRRTTRSSRNQGDSDKKYDEDQSDMQLEDSPAKKLPSKYGRTNGVSKNTKSIASTRSKSDKSESKLTENGSEFEEEKDDEYEPDFDSADEKTDAKAADSPPFKKMKLQEICEVLLDIKTLQHNIDSLKNISALNKIFAKSEGVLDEVLVSVGMLTLKPDLDNAVKTALLQASTMIAQAKKDYAVIFFAIRKLCLDLSNILKKAPAHQSVDCVGVSDTLYFYAVTFTYFTNYNYPSVSSHEEASVKKCDVPDFARYFTDNSLTPEQEAEVVKTDTKMYSSSYIWAQMTIWWKQTVEKPEATLSQERRGTLSYPTILQSFVHRDASDKEYDYPYGSRENWHRKLIESRAASWPIFKNIKRNLHTWSFRNDSRMYGTFLLEEVAFEGNYKEFVESVVKVLNKSDNERNKLFYKINAAYFKRINYKFPINIKELTDAEQQEEIQIEG